MKYNYKRLTISEYIDELYKDGLKKSNLLTDKEIEQRVQNIGIFRLKGYIKAFRDGLSNYSFEDIFMLYDTDRYISSMMFGLSSQVEIKLKAYIIETVYSLSDNPFFYLLKDSYIEEFSLSSESIYDWKIKTNLYRRNSEIYLHYQEYYLKNYNFDVNKQEYLSSEILIIDESLDINYPPFHYFIENLTLGSLIKILSKLKIDDKIILKIVAKKFGFYNERVFLNYLLRLKELRNRCAHNGRLFNRNYRGVKAFIKEHKKFRKVIYEHKLIDTYYTLCILLDKVEKFQNIDILVDSFKNDILKQCNKKIEDKIISIMMRKTR